MDIESLLNPDLGPSEKRAVFPSHLSKVPPPALPHPPPRDAPTPYQQLSSPALPPQPTVVIQYQSLSKQIIPTPSPSPQRTIAEMGASKKKANTPKKQPTPVSKTNAKTKAVFIESEASSPVHFHPFEVKDFPRAHNLRPQQRKELVDKCKLFNVYPTGMNGQLDIKSYPRHIPFSGGSPKNKRFNESTGRYGVDIFQYTFYMPNDSETEHQIMWDYQTGMVRTTAFFKAMDLNKTSTKKAIDRNHPDLGQVTFSLTGGNLGGQGYWWPYEIARALCLSFCWDIRWVLAPLFGPDFPFECQPPNEATKWKVNNELIFRAIEDQKTWKASNAAGNRIISTPFTSTTESFQSSTSTDQGPVVGQKQLRPRRPRTIVKEDSVVGVHHSHRLSSRISVHDDEDEAETERGSQTGDDDDNSEGENYEGSEEEDGDDDYTNKTASKPMTLPPSKPDSPPVSPKTLVAPRWTSINNPSSSAHSPPTKPTTPRALINSPIQTNSPTHRHPAAPATSLKLYLNRGLKRRHTPDPSSSAAAVAAANQDSEPETQPDGQPQPGTTGKLPPSSVPNPSLPTFARHRLRRPDPHLQSESDDEDIPLPSKSASSSTATSARAANRPTRYAEEEIEAARALALLKSVGTVFD